MKSVTEVKLAFACQESWNNFEQVTGGRFCGLCQHVVHDFTNATPEEMAEVIRKNPGKVCGRFRAAKSSTGIFKHAAIVTASIAVGACAQNTSPDISNEQTVSGNEFKMTDAEIDSLTKRITSTKATIQDRADKSDYFMGLVAL